MPTLHFCLLGFNFPLVLAAALGTKGGVGEGGAGEELCYLSLDPSFR